MKHFALHALALTAGMAACGLAGAHGDESHNPAAAQKSTPASEAKAATPIPATAGATWQAIEAKTAELGKSIQSGSLADVHHLAYAIRDLVAALPEQSQSLSADKLAKVKGSAKFVATLAHRLDASGDANDKAGAQANYEKLMKVLADLRANYATKPTLDR